MATAKTTPPPPSDNPETPPEKPPTNTEVYKNMQIPYCDRCGEKFRSDLAGNILCPDSLPDCPRLTK